MRVLDFLTRGTMVELIGTPFAKAYQQEDGSIKTEIRLNVSKTNILKPNYKDGGKPNEYEDSNSYDDDIEDFTIDEDEF